MSGRTGRPSRTPKITDPALLRLAPDVEPPPPGSLAANLWTGSLATAKDALATKYISGIGNGTLDPNDYGHYTIQDVAYCASAIEDFGTMASKAKALGLPNLAAFVEARQSSYRAYAQALGSAWHVSDPSGISPGPAAAQYLAFESLVATSYHPIYGIVVMIPCYKLWAWLANQLEPSSPPGNLYEFWITENSSFESAYRMDNFLNSWAAAHPGVVAPPLAQAVYEAAMMGELNFFRSAVGEAIGKVPLEP